MIEQLQQQRGLVTGVPSGFVDLDEMTSGFQKSDFVIVAARPSMGKTSLVLNMAMHCGIEAGKTVGIFSLEMSKEQLFLRMLTGEARVDAHRFRGGFLGEQDYARLVDAFGRIHDAKVFIDDTPGVGILEMRAKARRLKLEHGLDMLVVDYLQLMQGRGRFENRQQELASISRALKILAKELQIPILALSQLSRAPEARGDHRPQLSDLRESGALEQDADVVMFIFREEMYGAGGRAQARSRRDRRSSSSAKQRNGPTGTVRLAFLKQFTRFENLAAGRYDRGAEDRVSRPTVAVVEPRRGRGQLPSGPCAARSAARRRVWRRGPSSEPGSSSTSIIAVIKANAYGHGAAAVGRALESGGVSMPGVRRHRRGRVAPPVGGRRADSRLRRAQCQRSRRRLRSRAYADDFDAGGRPRARVRPRPNGPDAHGCHLKIDTGMNRLGFRHDNLGRTMPDVIASPHLPFDAVYTHLATAVTSSRGFDEQRGRFDRSAPPSVPSVFAGCRATWRIQPRSCAHSRLVRLRASGLLLYGSCRRRWPTGSTCDLPCHSPAVSWR